MKFRIKIYCQVFNNVDSGYRELTEFILIDQYADFPWEDYNISLVLSFI
jgi:hypothetical protein